MKLEYRKITFFNGIMTLFTLLLILYLILSLFTTHSFLDYEHFSFLTLGILGSCIPFVCSNLLRKKIQFIHKTMIVGSSKKKIPYEDILGIHIGWTKLRIITTSKNYSIRPEGVKNYTSFKDYLINDLKLKKISLYKSLELKVILEYLFIITCIASLLVAVFDREDTLKYHLPLASIKVQELEGELLHDIRIFRDIAVSGQLKLKEYPEYEFKYPRDLRNQSIQNEKNTVLNKGSRVKIRIRKRDHRSITQGKKKWEIDDLYRLKKNERKFYALEYESNILLEKHCLK